MSGYRFKKSIGITVKVMVTLNLGTSNTETSVNGGSFKVKIQFLKSWVKRVHIFLQKIF